MTASQPCGHNTAQPENHSEIRCQLQTWRVDELRPDPSYIRHGCSVSVSQMSALAALGALAFREPIIITRDRTIVDGYARWQLARQRGMESILCLEYDLTKAETLRWLIQSHRPSRGLNSYSRTLLALDLESSLQEQARANQQAGGREKGSSSLTEALDVRAEIASIAGVSTGNVTKVKQLKKTIQLRVEAALRIGEVSIHKAWQWSGLPPQAQLKELELYQGQKGTTKTSRQLIRKHVAKIAPKQLIMPSLGRLLAPLAPQFSAALDSVIVTEIEVPGKIAYLTTNALQALKSLEE